jgi:hypothetical protein
MIRATATPQDLEMFAAFITGILLVWWKLRQTVAYLANHRPRVTFPPRPRPAPRKLDPMTEMSWREVLSDSGVAPGKYRDDSEAAA